MSFQVLPLQATLVNTSNCRLHIAYAAYSFTFLAGSDTVCSSGDPNPESIIFIFRQTTSPIGTFFQVILMLPDIQRRAKKEIDAVVGSERLVTLDDRPFLPYIEALYREVMRWRPAVPLSVAHGSTVDDIYKGYFIPKGA